MEIHDWIVVGLGMITILSSGLSYLTRQQMMINKLEIDKSMSSMELRLSEKITGLYVTWQAHNDLEKRIDRMEIRLNNRDKTDE